MFKKMCYVRPLLLLCVAFNASSLFAKCLFHHPSIPTPHCTALYSPDNSGGWTFDVSADVKWNDLESTDTYLSGVANNEDWTAVNNVDGALYGFTVCATPPIWGKRLSVDFSHLTGDLKGSFNTREILPTPEGPYFGSVEFDRDEWELGMEIFILNTVYTRLEYSTFEMEGDWVYNDGSPNEAQRYTLNAFTTGAGFRQNIGSMIENKVFEKGLGLIFDVFAGLSPFEYKHKELGGGATVKTRGIGYELRTDLLGTYEIKIKNGSQVFVYAGIGYVYRNNNDDDLDLIDQGITGKFGIHVPL